MLEGKSPVVAFLPCRRGSQRVREKNIKPFAHVKGGLIEIKIQQLLECAEIDRLVVSTDDQVVADVCRIHAHDSAKPVQILERPAHLATSSTSTDHLIQYVPDIIDQGTVLWTHVTSPFVDSDIYTRAIKTHQENVKNQAYDSLMSVTKIQKFIWKQTDAFNYNRADEKWPRTQTLAPLYEVNSAIFIAPIEIYRNRQDRIGDSVHLFELTASEAMDIDWEEDFKLAEARWENGI